jgi:hypothetical protein
LRLLGKRFTFGFGTQMICGRVETIKVIEQVENLVGRRVAGVLAAVSSAR